MNTPPDPDPVIRTLRAMADTKKVMSEIGGVWRDGLATPHAMTYVSLRRVRGGAFDVGDGLNLAYYTEVDADDDRTLVASLDATWEYGVWRVDSRISVTDPRTTTDMTEAFEESLPDASGIADALTSHAGRLRDTAGQALAAFLAGDGMPLENEGDLPARHQEGQSR